MDKQMAIEPDEKLYDDLQEIVNALRNIGKMLCLQPNDEGLAFDTLIDELFSMTQECKVWLFALQKELSRLAGFDEGIT